MWNSSASWHDISLFSGVAPAFLAGLVALLSTWRSDPERLWRVCESSLMLALAAAALSGVAFVAGGSAATAWFRVDPAGIAMTALVAFVGWAIVRFSREYLRGESNRLGFLRGVVMALAGVFTVVAANNLLLLVLAWSATSFAMHRLLTFYPDRPTAAIAAHKKFIAARAADLCTLIAVGLLGAGFSTLRIDELAGLAHRGGALPASAQLAIVLVAMAAMLKCAQLPLQGWLLQVMEAPTPVSALLHAGVVNLGGFVLLRLAPLVDATPAAQGLLVIVGTVTAVLAALVATTRITIKVALAWSTCAQMGFMLIECGLGLWPMALLHLVAHSLYKAHAFLSAGSVVRESMINRLGAEAPASTLWGTLLAGAAALASVLLVGAAFGVDAGSEPALATMAAVFALALVPLLRGPGRDAPVRQVILGACASAAMAALWFGAHAAVARVLPGAAQPSPWWPVVLAAFVGLFVVQAEVRRRPEGPLARSLHPWCYGGFFVDERMHRLLFRVFPLPAAGRSAHNTLPI